ncbi:uncharacterized protein LOC130549894 [Triplophysa rosa]|uniref:uncharacterized protein LOC130549894 n=1 Tax=Triplophysa rosa TaxID=992332 RepID=UPI00254632F1|nr:uncharacterized protein LOC130549894 [Triplophysa rosa]
MKVTLDTKESSAGCSAILGGSYSTVIIVFTCNVTWFVGYMEKLKVKLPAPLPERLRVMYGRGRIAGGWKRKKWVFGMLGVSHRGKTAGKPVLRLVERRGRRDLVPLIVHHVRTGSAIISDEWRAYKRCLPHLGYRHFTVNHSVSYVDPRTGAHTQHIERAWRTYKEQVWRLRGNRSEGLLKDHLTVIEWNEWLAKKHKYGALGRLLHDIARQYK